MNKKYTLGPDVPADEPVYDSKGNLIDDSYIDQAVDDVRAGTTPSVDRCLKCE